ncbi:hypothetical protein HK101_008244 [Irineochytrium annulatum]|nr:hypothetical protein HK101_008244 [Irineochytrium annulatum]
MSTTNILQAANPYAGAGVFTYSLNNATWGFIPADNTTFPPDFVSLATVLMPDNNIYAFGDSFYPMYRIDSHKATAQAISARHTVGPNNTDGLQSELWELTLATWTWTLIEGGNSTTATHPQYAPDGRMQHSAVAAGNYMIVTGGMEATDTFAQTIFDTNVYFFDMTQRTWVSSPTSVIQLPEALALKPTGYAAAVGSVTPSLSAAPAATGAQSGGGTIASTAASAAASSTSSQGPSLVVIAAAVGGLVVAVVLVVVTIVYLRAQKAKAAQIKQEKEKVQQLANKPLDFYEFGQAGSTVSSAHGMKNEGMKGDNSYGSSGHLFPTDTMKNGYTSGNSSSGQLFLPSVNSGLPPYAGEAVYHAASAGSSTPPPGSGGGFERARYTVHKCDDSAIEAMGGAIISSIRPSRVQTLDLAPAAVVMDRFRITGMAISSAGSRFLVLPAEDVQSGDKVAVKIYGLNDPSLANAAASFKREVTVLKKLQSPGVVELKAFGMMDIDDQNYPERIYVSVMQLHQESLASFIQRRRNVPDLGIRTIVKGVVDALAFLHGEGIVHADLKPSNVLLVDGLFVKLIDFETARIANRETITAASFAYAPPEVIHAHRQNMLSQSSGTGAASVEVVAQPSMDMWGLGLIIFELYAKRALTSDLPPDALIEFLSANQPDPIPVGPAQVENAQARHLLTTLLTRDPDQRKTARAVLASAYLNAGLDTVQLQTSYEGVSRRLDRVQQVTNEIQNDQRAMMAELAAVRRTVVGSLRPICPRIVVMVPQGKGRWDDVRAWGCDMFRLHLLCEWRGDNHAGGCAGPHFTDDVGYPIADPGHFVRTIGPILRAGVKISAAAVGMGVSIVSGRGGGGGGGPDQMLASLGVRPTEYFEMLTRLIEEVSVDDQVRGGGGDVVRARTLDGQTLRELEAFLQHEDPGRRLGSLHRVSDVDGSIVWLCEAHAKAVWQGAPASH